MRLSACQMGLYLVGIPYHDTDKSTHWGRDKMAAISQTTLSNAFSWIKMFEISIKISLKFVPKGPINNIPALFRRWLGSVQAASHYLNQWWLVYRRIYASLGLNQLKTCQYKCGRVIKAKTGNGSNCWSSYIKVGQEISSKKRYFFSIVSYL